LVNFDNFDLLSLQSR